MSDEGAIELSFDDQRLVHQVAGQQDEHLRSLERLLGVRIASSAGGIHIQGDAVQRELAGRVVRQL